MADITDKSFDTDVLNSKTPVLVDFWAPWCGPCKMLGPILEALEAEMGEKIKIVKINIDDNPETPTKYGVRGIPTMMIFQEGKVLATKVGALPKASIEDWINSSIA